MPTASPLPPKRELPAGRFERDLASGEFVITAEIAPGTAANASGILAQAKLIAPWVNAINVTDGAGAHTALSSMAACALLVRNGYTAVLQMTCRDRNRIALQSDLLGATALGIENVLCLTGDGVGNGDHPGAKPVFDLDAISLLATARTLRDGGTFLSGRTLTAPPQYFLGAVENPFAPPQAARVQRVQTKIDAGAQFLMTQMVYDVPAFELFMAEYVGWDCIAGPTLLLESGFRHPPKLSLDFQTRSRSTDSRAFDRSVGDFGRSGEYWYLHDYQHNSPVARHRRPGRSTSVIPSSAAQSDGRYRYSGWAA